MKEYQVLEYDVNSPVEKAVSVPLDSVYGLAVKVFKDGEPVELSGDELSVGGQTGQGEADGYSLFVLSSGSEPCSKQLDVEVSKSGGETYEYGETTEVSQALNRETKFTIQLGAFLSGYVIAPSNISEFEMSSTMTPDAGGDPVAETYELSNLQFYGRAPDGTIGGWWKIVDGRWSDNVGIVTADTITLETTGTRNVEIRTSKTYPKSTGTAAFKLVFKFGDGEDLSTKFKLVVQEKDMGHISF